MSTKKLSNHSFIKELSKCFGSAQTQTNSNLHLTHTNLNRDRFIQFASDMQNVEFTSDLKDYSVKKSSNLVVNANYIQETAFIILVS